MTRLGRTQSIACFRLRSLNECVARRKQQHHWRTCVLEVSSPGSVDQGRQEKSCRAKARNAKRAREKRSSIIQRGLGADYTLILINGRRISATGTANGAFVDAWRFPSPRSNALKCAAMARQATLALSRTATRPSLARPCACRRSYQGGRSVKQAPDWALLFREEAPRLMRRLRRFGDRIVPEDIVQSAFAIIIEMDASAIEDPRAYLARLTRNLALDELRRLQRARTICTSDDD